MENNTPSSFFGTLCRINFFLLGSDCFVKIKGKERKAKERKGKEMLINNCCAFGAVLLVVCNCAVQALGGSEEKAFV